MKSRQPSISVQPPPEIRRTPGENCFCRLKKELDKGMAESVEFPPLLNMKNSPLMTILLALLLISAALSLLFFGLYIHRSRQFRALQFQVSQINNRSAAINQLMNDVVEYSKRSPNRDIEHLLENFGVTNKPPVVK